MKKTGAILALMVLACWGAASAQSDKVHVTFVFVDFYDDYVSVVVDGHKFWSGKLTVEKENKTLGLSMAKESDLPRCSDIVVYSKRFADKARVCLTDKTKAILVSAKTEPHISAREQVELD